jgi:hypothetical protein
MTSKILRCESDDGNYLYFTIHSKDSNIINVTISSWRKHTVQIKKDKLIAELKKLENLEKTNEKRRH